MSADRVRWDNRNVRHLLVEHADRDISPAEVEQVVLGRQTVRWFARGGRLRALGRTAAGRCLTVIYEGIQEMRPVTAWETPGKECERWET